MEDYPETMLEFEQRFANEKRRREYLYQMRWPDDGFIVIIENVRRRK